MVSISEAFVAYTSFAVIEFQILVSVWALYCNVLIESTIYFLSGFVWFDTSKLASYYLLLFLFQIFLSQISIIFNIATSLWFQQMIIILCFQCYSFVYFRNFRISLLNLLVVLILECCGSVANWFTTLLSGVSSTDANAFTIEGWRFFLI